MQNEMTMDHAADTVLLLENGKTVFLPASETEIGFRELWGAGVAELRCGPAVKKIRERNFQCYNMRLVQFPEGLEEIGTWAFFGCAELKEVTIPRSVKYIGESAFTSCLGLKRVTILSPDTELGVNAFHNCPKDMLMVVPKGSPAENHAIESGYRYIYSDGTEPEGLSLVRISDDGALLEHCYFRVQYMWECCAESDGGIDDRKKEFATYRIPSSLLLWKGKKLLGVHSREHDFLLADPSTHEYEKILDKGFVGGWGDVEESVTWRLFIGPPPKDAGLVTEGRMPWFMHYKDWRLF